MKHKKLVIILCLIGLAAILGLVFTGSDAEKMEHSDHRQHDDHDDHIDLVRLSKEQLEEFDITIERAGPGTLKQFVSVPGEIVPNQDKLSHISARFPGIVVEVLKQIGDEVSKGEVLAVGESKQS